MRQPSLCSLARANGTILCVWWGGGVNDSVMGGVASGGGVSGVVAGKGSAFYRALGKSGFAECGTRQRPALGKELVYRV
jgi:hypothetical protein